jgi:hypothetical protein
MHATATHVNDVDVTRPTLAGTPGAATVDSLTPIGEQNAQESGGSGCLQPRRMVWPLGPYCPNTKGRQRWPSDAKARLKMIRKARFAAWLSAPLSIILFPLAELKSKQFSPQLFTGGVHPRRRQPPMDGPWADLAAFEGAPRRSTCSSERPMTPATAIPSLKLRRIDWGDGGHDYRQACAHHQKQAR